MKAGDKVQFEAKMLSGGTAIVTKIELAKWVYNRVMLFRYQSRGFARVALAAILFAQATIAVAACGMVARSPALAFEAEMDMPCHEAPQKIKNLCLADCLSADQSAGTPQVVVPAWSGTASLIVAAAGYTGKPIAMPRRMAPRAAAPPPRILFQSFLI